MSKDSITFRLPCACEHVLEIACSIAVDQGFKITKTDKRGFSAKESVKWGFTNPVTLHVTFLNEHASTRVTINSSNIGFGPVQSNHVRKRMMDFKEELLDLVNTSSMTFSHGDKYPEEEMETSEGGRLINSNREVNTHSQRENNVRVGDHPASNQIKYMVYAIGGILALVLIYSSPVIFLLISAIGSVCWVADALGLAKAANWSAIGRLRQKSEQVYWSTGLIFFLVLVISLFFVNIKPSSVKETETVSEDTFSTHVANTSQPSIANSNPPRQNVESSPSTISSLDRVISNNVGSEQQTEGIPDKKVTPPLNGDGPRLVVLEPEYNFGKINSNKLVEHDFILRNAGTSILKIENIQTTCGCTTAEMVKDEIALNEEVPIHVMFDTKGRQGPQTQSVTIASNDPANPTLELRIVGEAIASIHIEPTAVQFGRIEDDNPREAKVVIQSNKEEITFQIESVESDGLEFIQHEIEEVEPGKKYELHFKTIGNLPVGNHNGRFIIRTDSAERSVIWLPVSLQVIGALEVMPSAVYIRYSENPDELERQQLSITAGRVDEFVINEVVIPLNTIEYELLEVGTNDYKLRLSNMPCTRALEGKAIILRTNLVDTPEVKIPFYIYEPDASTPISSLVADIPQPSVRKPNAIAPLPDNSKLTTSKNTSGEYQQKKEYDSTIQEQSEIPATIPNEQHAFVNIINTYARQYDEASNDIRRSAARAERKKALQRYVDSPGAENWSGKITSIDIEADNTTIEIQLTDTEITLTNYVDAFLVSMTPENTIIRSDMSIYQKVLPLKEGDYVRFNFRFEPGLPFTDDGLYQTRITENNSMVKPIFLVEFWDIEKYIQGSPSLDKRVVAKATTATTIPGEPVLSQDQQIFNSLIEKYSRQYAEEGSEIRKTQLRRDRKNELIPYGTRGNVQNWIGKVDNINLSSDGAIMLSVVLNGSRTKIMNYLDAVFFGMSIEDVLIKPGTNLFETVADLKEDDLIVVDFMFLGDSIYAEEDGIIQMELSEEESMRVPEFLVEFVGAAKWTPQMRAHISNVQPSVSQTLPETTTIVKSKQEQTAFTDPDDKIIENYLSENLPDYRLLNASDYEDDLSTYFYSIPWRCKGDFDGNGQEDLAFIALNKSRTELAILVLNRFSYGLKHTLLEDGFTFSEGFQDICIGTMEPGPIDGPAGTDYYDENRVTFGIAEFPYISWGVIGSEIFGEYWWQDGRYRSSFEEYKPYREASPSQLAIVNVQDSLNLRESPSTNANIVTKLPPGAQVIIIERPYEKYPWVKIQFYRQKGWVHKDYLTSEENEYVPEEPFIEDEELKVTIPTSASIGEGQSIIKVTAQNPVNEERTGTIAFSIEGGKPIVQKNPSAYDLFEVGGHNKLLRFSSEGNEWRPLDSTEAISPSMVHVELYDEKWAAGEMKTLSCPVSFTEPGEVLILVRATFSRKSPEGTIVDKNFPVQGHNDEQGLPCALYRVSVTSGILNPRKDVISQTTEQTAAYAVAEAHAASPQEAILDQTIVYFNKLVNKDLDGAMVGISDTFEHSEYGSKAKLKAFLEEAKQAGNLDDLRLIMDYAEVKFEGDKAVVYPVDVEGSFGSITLELTCTKEGDTWKLTTMDIFGI